MVPELFMNRNIAGNGKVNQDLMFAEKAELSMDFWEIKKEEK